tara:strand:- start:107 stop:403 length:297 start_codon:yes stop_codon:yes gene_type:complete
LFFVAVGFNVGSINVLHNPITDLNQDLIDNVGAEIMTDTDERERIFNTLRTIHFTDSDLKSIQIREENSEAAIVFAYGRRGPVVANPSIAATFDESMR